MESGPTVPPHVPSAFRMRPIPSLLVAMTLLSLAGCLTRSSSKAPAAIPAAPPPDKIAAFPFPAKPPSVSSSAHPVAALVERAANVRGVSVYLDSCVETTTPAGRGVSADRNRLLGEIATAALRHEFEKRGFEVRGAFLTSVGLGLEGPATAPARSTAVIATSPYFVSEVLAGNERRRWFEGIYPAIRAFASGHAAPDSLRLATYLNANTPRLLCFAVVIGNEPTRDVRPKREARVILSAAITDSETGRVLWTNRSTVTGAALDEDHVHQLAERLFHEVPSLTPSIQ